MERKHVVLFALLLISLLLCSVIYADVSDIVLMGNWDIEHATPIDSMMYCSSTPLSYGNAIVMDGTKDGRIGLTMGTQNHPIRAHSYVKYDGMVYFAGEDSVYKTDGTRENTVGILANDGSAIPNADQLTVSGGKLYFRSTTSSGSSSRVLWVTDGTESGTVKLYEFDNEISQLTAFDNRLFFIGNDATHGIELWVSDGTIQGTTYFADLNPAGDSQLGHLTATKDYLYFTNDIGGPYYMELYKSDGTPPGTEIVKDLNDQSHEDGDTWFWNDFFVADYENNRIFFAAACDSFGLELFTSNGTEGGTFRVTDINIDNKVGFGYADYYLGNSAPEHMTLMDGSVYFAANDSSGDRELWRVNADGSYGAQLIENINPSGSSGPNKLTVFLNTLYFFAADGTHGIELWESDGTAGGTNMVADLDSGADNGVSGEICATDNDLFFEGNLSDDDFNDHRLFKLGPHSPPSIQSMSDTLIEMNSEFVERVVTVSDDFTEYRFLEFSVTADSTNFITQIGIDGNWSGPNFTKRVIYLTPATDATGTTTITVTASDQTAPPATMSFELTVTDSSLTPAFEVTSPTDVDSVLAGGELIIEWDAYLVDSVKVEHYISGADTDWVLDEIVPAANTPYTWTAPDTTTHDCNIRITAVGADIPSTSFRGFTLYEDPSWIADTPAEFSLSHPYPNPFNPSTTIDYALPSTSHVRMTVYNAMGQEVAELVDDRQAAGRYTVQWNAAGLSSGVYFYRIEAGEFMETGKMLLMK